VKDEADYRCRRTRRISPCRAGFPCRRAQPLSSRDRRLRFSAGRLTWIVITPCAGPYSCSATPAPASRRKFRTVGKRLEPDTRGRACHIPSEFIFETACVTLPALRSWTCWNQKPVCAGVLAVDAPRLSDIQVYDSPKLEVLDFPVAPHIQRNRCESEPPFGKTGRSSRRPVRLEFVEPRGRKHRS
jgi:hypothetical protein